MGSLVLPALTTKRQVDTIIRDTLDKVVLLRFGRASDFSCLHLDDILAKASQDVSRFAAIGLVDVDMPEVQVYVQYFDITLMPATVFFFNAHHMKMDSGTADHTKWIGSFHSKQDFVDVVEELVGFLPLDYYVTKEHKAKQYLTPSFKFRDISHT